VRFGGVRTQLDRSNILCHRVLEKLQILQCIPKVDVCLREIGGETNGMLEAKASLTRPAHALEDIAQIIVEGRKVGSDVDGPGYMSKRYLIAPGGVSQHAEKVQRIRVVRIAAEDFAVDRLRRFKASGPLVIESFCERLEDGLHRGNPGEILAPVGFLPPGGA
jgi:hypothetical protein